MVRRRIFIAFAKEDEPSRNLFSGQKVNSLTPVEFVDMTVKEPYSSSWKSRTRTRIRGSHRVIALISSNTALADGELWEIGCAVEEGKPLLGIWVGGCRTKPTVMKSATCKAWTWENVSGFINGLQV